MALMVARLRASLPKPEALASVSDATAAQHLADAIGLVTSALGDRIPPGSVVVQWDAALDRAARILAAVSLYNLRGRNRQAGADESIDREQERADAYLARLRSPDREEQPVFALSPGGSPADAPLVSSEPTAQHWTRSRCRPGRILA
ncbi:MAG TPA: hypothetical protein VLT61_12195 [Anaeromyxobacteraceae bacterium]|nr:hypothetical protein [Anaeromyxobacteraceae bacterium]